MKTIIMSFLLLFAMPVLSCEESLLEEEFLSVEAESREMRDNRKKLDDEERKLSLFNLRIKEARKALSIGINQALYSNTSKSTTIREIRYPEINAKENIANGNMDEIYAFTASRETVCKITKVYSLKNNEYFVRCTSIESELPKKLRKGVKIIL